MIYNETIMKRNERRRRGKDEEKWTKTKTV